MTPFDEIIETCRFVEAVPEHFLCVVCREVPRNPYEHGGDGGCGIVMCKACRAQYRNRKQRACPLCRRDDVNCFTPLQRILRVHYFDAMKLRCQHFPNCEAVVSVSKLQCHEESCEHRTVRCPVCPLSMKRHELAAHIIAAGAGHVELLVNMLVETPMCVKMTEEVEESDKDDMGFGLFGEAYDWS